MRSIAWSASPSVLGRPSRLRTTNPSRTVSRRRSACSSVLVMGIVRRVRPFGVVVTPLHARRGTDRAGAPVCRGRAPPAGLNLTDHLDEAVADVERALVALRSADLLGEGQTFRLEYPIAVAREGHLIVGYLDFVSATVHETAVIDFKTDVAPRGNIAERYPRGCSGARCSTSARPASTTIRASRHPSGSSRRSRTTPWRRAWRLTAARRSA
jgi:hypothetical protein